MLQPGRVARTTFGKRGVIDAQGRRADEFPNAGIAFGRSASAADKVVDPDGLTIRRASPGSSVTWAYVKACAVAFATVIAISVLFGGSRSPFADKSLFQNIIGIVVAPTLGGVMAIPTFLLVQIVSFLGIRRGVADILVGGSLGSAWLLLALYDGIPLTSLHFAFLTAGCVGGFVFWRAQGYPGASPATVAVLGQAYDRAR